jgi:hypothetical protein
MKHYAGSDVSVKETCVCIVDGTGTGLSRDQGSRVIRRTFCEFCKILLGGSNGSGLRLGHSPNGHLRVD